MNALELKETARAIVAPGKGILAADESFPTIEKRFRSIDVPSTEQNRRDYREILFTTPGVGEFLGGVILFDETLRQKASSGTSFTRVLSGQGIVPGIKVDKGAKALALAPGEKVTEGLDGLRDRLNEYRELGAGFTKWRAVITIGEGLPSSYCIECNAHALARVAALSQEAGLVPIVEPEVLMDGDHTIERCEEVTGATLHAVYDALYRQRVYLEGTLLKPNMVLSGRDCDSQASDQRVAEATVRCFLDHVPASVPGIVFLSGGQSDLEATRRLNAMNALGTFPWELSFSYGRALQAPVLRAWQGRAENHAAAQKALYHRAKCNSAARSGSYSDEMEREVA
ncbi:MAG: class I fructose-bisphosphate aldolase [Acidobacteriota bacterium]